MTARSLTRGELISAGSALLLLVIMVAVAWYGVDGIPGHRGGAGMSGSETGWQGMSGVRWLVLITVLLSFAAVGVHGARVTRRAVAGMRLALLVLAWATALVLLVRVLIDLPAPERVVDQKLGAVIGLVASFGVAYGAAETIREQRARLAAGQ